MVEKSYNRTEGIGQNEKPMKASKNMKIAVFLLLMFVTAYPTFLALATIRFLIGFYFTKAPLGTSYMLCPATPQNITF